MMNTQRKQHWEQIYHDKSPLEVSWYQKEPNLSLQLIANTGVKSNAPIIDVGGGASVLVDRLLDLGYTDLTVLDISAEALQEAQARLGQQAARVKWLETDITEFVPSRDYGLWHDRAVFHFLTEAGDRRRYVQVMNRSLQPQGHVIIAAFAVGGPTQCSGLDIVQYDAEKLAGELGENYELWEQDQELHITPANKEQRFGYFRFKKRD